VALPLLLEEEVEVGEVSEVGEVGEVGEVEVKVVVDAVEVRLRVGAA